MKGEGEEGRGGGREEGRGGGREEEHWREKRELREREKQTKVGEGDKGARGKGEHYKLRK